MTLWTYRGHQSDAPGGPTVAEIEAAKAKAPGATVLLVHRDRAALRVPGLRTEIERMPGPIQFGLAKEE